MSDIRYSIEQLNEPEKSIGKLLIEFHKTMKGLEHDPARDGMRATKIVMTINDVQKIVAEYAQQTAIEFSEWLGSNGYEYLPMEDKWERRHIRYTTSELYQQFKNKL